MNARYRKQMLLRSRRHRRGPQPKRRRTSQPIRWERLMHLWAPEPCHHGVNTARLVRQLRGEPDTHRGRAVDKVPTGELL